MKKIISIFLMLSTTNCHAIHSYLKNVYIDNEKNVHIISAEGQDEKISKIGDAAGATLSPDKRSAAWLVLNSWIAEGDIEPGASQLAIYRDGQLRHIQCEPFIRDYWFWMQGRQVAIDCGGRHFAGTQSLFDIDTLLMIDSFFQPDISEDKRPVWSK